MMPRGFFFSPLDHEVIYHLHNKASDHNYNVTACIQDLDFYSLNPDQISLKKHGNGTSSKAYFFTYLPRKDGDGKPDRSTSDGYWEEIGGDVAIIDKRAIVGYKNTFAFRFLSADEGKDNFYMDEFRLNPSFRSDDPNMRNNIKNLVVCKVERMSPHCFLIPKVQWVEGANGCSDDEVEEEKINTSPEAV